MKIYDFPCGDELHFYKKSLVLYFDGTLAKTAISCAEAKVAALQELMASSRYSGGLATGSGTDGIIVVCNPESENVLTDAGHHSELGECIGKSMKKQQQNVRRKVSCLAMSLKTGWII